MIGALGTGTWYELYARWHQSTDDAYVDGNVVAITPQVTGTVTSIEAEDGDLVNAGQPLIRLDPSDTEVQLEQAQANLGKTVRQVRGLFKAVDIDKAQIKGREADLNRDRADYQRRVNLAKRRMVSDEELAHARDALSAAKSALSAAQEQLERDQALVQGTTVMTNPDVKAAEATLRQAYLAHARTTIVAPVTGYVAERKVQLGQHVDTNTPLMAVVPLNQVWVEANFKETQLSSMRIGQPVTVTTDLYGSHTAFKGTVEALGMGTGSAFSLLPAQNATGNWIKIVQRVPVRIHLDPKQLQQHPLRIGLSTEVDVDLHDQSGPVLAQKPVDKPVLTTAVYQQELSSANTLINQVLADNGAADDARLAMTKTPKHH